MSLNFIEDNISENLYILPYSWDYYTENTSSLNFPNQIGLIKEKSETSAFIECFGYTKNGKSIYLKIKKPETYVLKFDSKIEKETLQDLFDYFGPDNITVSKYLPNVALLTNPSYDPLMDSDSVTWIDIRKDPRGILHSFWAFQKIQPYSWIEISSYEILDENPKSEINLLVPYWACLSINDIEKYKLEEFNIYLARMFWDLETYSPNFNEFPDPYEESNKIILNSPLYSKGDFTEKFLLHLGKMGPLPIDPELKVEGFNNESEMTEYFYSLIDVLKPDRMYTYNGDGFDIPYLSARTKLYNIDIGPIGKNKDFNVKVEKGLNRTPFGIEEVDKIPIQGIEQIDLLKFFRIFEPDLPNHKLETVSKKYLGVGKTGLEIVEVFKAFEQQDLEKLSQSGKYSLQDSVLLKQLVQVSKVDMRLENLANTLGLTIPQILEFGIDMAIVDMLIMEDPGLVFYKGIWNNIDLSVISILSRNLKIPRGSFKNVFVYDYSELYVDLMKNSPDELTSSLGRKAQGLPSNLIINLFESIYINRIDLIDKIVNFLEFVQSLSSLNFPNVTILEITKTTFKISLSGNLNKAPSTNSYEKELQFPDKFNKYITLVEEYDNFISITDSSYISKDRNGIITKKGTSSIINPPFEFMKEYVDKKIDYLMGMSVIDPERKMINKQTDPVKLISISRIKNKSNYNEKFWKYSLSEQIEKLTKKEIKTWVSVKWIKVKDYIDSKGSFAILVEDPIKENTLIISKNYKIDQYFYNTKMRLIKNTFDEIVNYF